MSGMVARRLFALMPPLMPVSQKYQIVESIWKQYGPTSRKYVYVGPDSVANDVLAAIEAYFSSLTVLYVIPARLEREFDWLSDNDVQVKQHLLNHFMDEQRRSAIASATLNLTMILDGMKSDTEHQISKLSHTVFVGNHQLEMRADPLRSGFVLSDSASDAILPKSQASVPGCIITVGVLAGGIWLLGKFLGWW